MNKKDPPNKTKQNKTKQKSGVGHKQRKDGNCVCIDLCLVRDQNYFSASHIQLDPDASHDFPMFVSLFTRIPLLALPCRLIREKERERERWRESIANLCLAQFSPASKWTVKKDKQ